MIGRPPKRGRAAKRAWLARSASALAAVIVLSLAAATNTLAQDPRPPAGGGTPAGAAAPRTAIKPVAQPAPRPPAKPAKVTATGDGGAAVVAEVERTQLQLGDSFDFTVKISRLPGDRYTLPDAPDFGKLTLIDYVSEEKETQGDAVMEIHRWTLGAFALGEHEVPEMTVLKSAGVDGEVKELTTNAIPVAVFGSLSEEEQAQLGSPEQIAALVDEGHLQLQDAKVPLYWPLYLLVGLLGGGLLGWLLTWAYRRFRREEIEAAAPPPPPRPAHEVAYERLEALKAADHLGKGEFKVFTFELSEILRDYLGRRYLFDALEMTTTELVDALRLMAPVDLQLRDIEAFAYRTDMVKYAKAEASALECAELMQLVYRLVERSKKLPTPEALDADAAAGSSPTGAAAASPATPTAASSQRDGGPVSEATSQTQPEAGSESTSEVRPSS